MKNDFVFRPHFASGFIPGNGTDNFSGSIQMFRGDKLCSVRLLLYTPAATDIPSPPTFKLQADNGAVATLGVGSPLPVTSSPILFSASVPYTTAAMNATAAYFAVDLTIPIGLVADDTTRDVLFDINTGDTPSGSYFVVIFDIEPAGPLAK